MQQNRNPLCIYDTWLAKVKDPLLRRELLFMWDQKDRIRDAFRLSLSFGTGGLRGVMGAGTDRLNIYTVRRATRGLAAYLFAYGGKRVAIGYDTRKNSRLFAETAANTLAACGLSVFLFDKALPTPMLSYAVRALSCDAGIVITASHNPREYNGYKVYGADGCQITDGAAAEISAYIAKEDYFSEPEAVTGGSITPIPEDVFDGFLSSVRATSVLYGDACDRTVPIVYTPLHGTGALPVTRILREAGFSSVFTVAEQMRPDGDFPTCPYPNPEIPEALSLGMAEAERRGAELLLATDPDSDRVGVAVKGKDGFTILDGNEVGLLLLDYILSQKKGHGASPSQPTVVKTVVTTPLADVIAADFGAKTVNVLTGFKYIGDVIGKMEREGRADGYLFGFEESCGYLGGTYVRDKDGVFAAFMIAEMCGFYRAKGVSLADALASLYEKYGKRKNFLHSYTFRGEAGDLSMREMMARMRGGDTPFSGIVSREDYLMAHEDLPPSDVLAFTLSDGCTVTVRPSGTEPKLKLYLSVTGADEEEITARHGALVRAFEEVLPV